MDEASENVRIDAAVEAITHGVYDSGVLGDPDRWWPRSYLPYSPLFAADLHANWIEDWQRVPPGTKYARGTAVWVLLAMASRSLKAMFDTSERVNIFLRLLDDISRTTAGDIYCRDGSHQVLEASSAQELLERISLFEASDRAGERTFSALNGTLLAYSEAVFFSANCTVRDIHGPYKVVYQGQPAQLLVRDYHRLRDAELESLSARAPADSVTTYSVYKEDVRFHFSVVNDYASDQPLKDSVLAHGAEIGGTMASPSDAAHATRGLVSVIQAVGAKVRALPEHDQVWEVVRRAYYRRQPVSAAVQSPWEPSDEVERSVREQLARFAPQMPPPVARDAFKAAIDPRV